MCGGVKWLLDYVVQACTGGVTLHFMLPYKNNNKAAHDIMSGLLLRLLRLPEANCTVDGVVPSSCDEQAVRWLHPRERECPTCPSGR